MPGLDSPVDDLQGLFNKGDQVILFQKYALLIWLKASVEGLGLRTVRPDIFALSALYSAPMQLHSAGDFAKEFLPASTAVQCVAPVPKPSAACGDLGAGAAFVGTVLGKS